MFFQTLLHLFGLSHFVKCRRTFPQLNSSTRYLSLKREKKIHRVHVLHKTSHLIGSFTSWSYSGRERNIPQSAIHVECCCFADKINVCFFRFLLPSSSGCSGSPVIESLDVLESKTRTTTRTRLSQY